VRRRRATQGLFVSALVLVSCLAPAAPVLASTSRASQQSATNLQATRKAVVPHAVLCSDVKAQEASQSHLGLALARALGSGHVDRVKRGMLSELDAVLKKEGTAQTALKGSPRKVQEAERHLIADAEHVKTAVARSTSINELLKAFAMLGRNTHMAVDGLTLANWYGSQCPKPHPPEAHPGTPGSSPATSGTAATSPTSTTSGSHGSGGAP
jgi:hypothetical protein